MSVELSIGARRGRDPDYNGNDSNEWNDGETPMDFLAGAAMVRRRHDDARNGEDREPRQERDARGMRQRGREQQREVDAAGGVELLNDLQMNVALERSQKEDCLRGRKADKVRRKADQALFRLAKDASASQDSH